MTPRTQWSWLTPWRLDWILAAALLVLCESEVSHALLIDHGHDHWPLAANLLFVLALTVPLGWRRRLPLASMTIVMGGVLLLLAGTSDVTSVNSPQLVLFIAPYSVAAYAHRDRAVVGLVASVVLLSVGGALSHAGPGSLIFDGGVCLGSWAAGRVLRARRITTAELKTTTDRIAAEREGHEFLAIAAQRSVIARELQTLVAHSVSSMIVQTQAARQLLDHDLQEADLAMATIEDTGRAALIEMRRILGVLRHDDAPSQLAPQPGVGQIAALVEQARRGGRRLTLRVEGEPGPLPASVDLGIYRILEDAVTSVENLTGRIDVQLSFGAQDIALNVTVEGSAGLDWPTVATRERVALCQGSVAVQTNADNGERLAIRLPREFDGALA